MENICLPPLQKSMSRTHRRNEDFFPSVLKHKSEVAAKIREYVGMAQNRFGRKPRIIRSDQGGEEVA